MVLRAFMLFIFLLVYQRHVICYTLVCCGGDNGAGVEKSDNGRVGNGRRAALFC